LIILKVYSIKIAIILSPIRVFKHIMVVKKTEVSPKKVAPKKVAPKKVVKPAAKKASKAGAPLAHGVGRRKTSVARAWLRRGKGDLIVNDIPFKEYFDTDVTRLDAAFPLTVVPHADKYDAHINIYGGGKHAQAGAVKLAVSRAFVAQDETLRPLLRKYGLLTVDARIKERKKYGQKAARRKFQFVKR
jgi:small subunit ribosomal protein S9